MEMNISKKKIILDLMLNITSSIIITMVSQLVVYPFIANAETAFEFGNVLTIVGIINIIGGIFGGALNNVKLIRNNIYVLNNINGDFKLLMRWSAIIGILSINFFLFINGYNFSILNTILITLLALLTLYRSYLTVYYRIEMNYRNILFNSVVIAVGYLFGLLFYQIYKNWTIIFLVGEVFGLIFNWITTNYKIEFASRTVLYYETKKSYLQLICSSIMVNLILYADRLLIHPILGAENVTVYYVSSLVGKTIGIILQPAASVILTYLAKMELRNNKKVFMYNLVLMCSLSLIFYVILIPVSPFIIKIFYSEYFEQSLKFVNLANLSTLIFILGNMIQPFTLKFCPLRVQSHIQLVYGGIYVLLSVIFMDLFGLLGFCYSSIIANLMRLIITIVFGLHYIDKKDKV